MNDQLKEKIKETHNAYYKKMGWRHNADCVCKSWDLKEQTYFDSVRKQETELEAITKRSATEENFTADNLGF